MALADTPSIQTASNLLKAGKLVAFPTETVYGLGADARNEDAIDALYQVKERPASHPVIVHLADKEQLRDWASPIPDIAWALADKFWPGPLTLILKKAPHVSPKLTGGQDTIALRVPKHSVALELLKIFQGGIAAPSANKFGQLSPTTAAHVQQGLNDDVELILDGGPCDVGVESTILNLSGRHPVILRPGMISQRAIEQILGEPVSMNEDGLDETRTSGALPSHYAPKTPLELVDDEDLLSKALSLENAGKRVAILAYTGAAFPDAILLPHDPEGYARQLYAELWLLDAEAYDAVLVEKVPATDEWAAVADRLKRAAASETQSSQSEGSLVE